MPTIEKMKNTKAHTTYRLADGTKVPGTTTVLSVLDKGRGLLVWANQIGLEGIDLNKYVDKLANVGTLAHYMIQCELTGKQPDFSAYSPEEKDRAENALLKFYEWQRYNKIEAILTEQPLVSEQYRYGGTIDVLALVNGAPVLLDIKTSKTIYPEYTIQLAAYWQLLKENGYGDIENARILRIGRDESEGFEEKLVKVNELADYFEIFKHCLEIYRLKKKLKF